MRTLSAWLVVQSHGVCRRASDIDFYIVPIWEAMSLNPAKKNCRKLMRLPGLRVEDVNIGSGLLLPNKC